jgi:hypothetical protein
MARRVGKKRLPITGIRMTLHNDAERLIRANLAEVSRKGKPRVVAIGVLTDEQLRAINEHRQRRNFAPIEAVIVFSGKHIYKSRIEGDGYSVDDVIKQISSAMSSLSRLRISPKMTAIENPAARDDGYGNRVNDQAVLECTAKFPRAELYSVIPRGDRNRPGKSPETGKTPGN